MRRCVCGARRVSRPNRLAEHPQRVERADSDAKRTGDGRNATFISDLAIKQPAQPAAPVFAQGRRDGVLSLLPRSPTYGQEATGPQGLHPATSITARSPRRLQHARRHRKSRRRAARHLKVRWQGRPLEPGDFISAPTRSDYPCAGGIHPSAPPATGASTSTSAWAAMTHLDAWNVHRGWVMGRTGSIAGPPPLAARLTAHDLAARVLRTSVFHACACVVGTERAELRPVPGELGDEAPASRHVVLRTDRPAAEALDDLVALLDTRLARGP